MSRMRKVVVPLVVALLPAYWIAAITYRASLTPLGRDQGIFQYVAWALRRGAVDYRDVRDVNGPLTHAVHVLFETLGGADEHRFRCLDLTVTGLTFAIAGACLPGTFRPRRVGGGERLAWALAAWVVLSGQYLSYLYWDLAQRESFFDWFVLGGMTALSCATKSARPPSGSEGEGALPSPPPTLLYALSGALLAIPWFGKATYVLFSLAAAASIGRRKELRPFAVGSLVGAGVPLLFVAAYGDLAAFFRLYFVDVPAMYRFTLARTAVEIARLEWVRTTAALVVITSSVHIARIVRGDVSRATLAFALMPLAALGSVFLQSKGYYYHLHPVTLALHLEWLLGVVWLVETERVALRASSWAAALLALKTAAYAVRSPHWADKEVTHLEHGSREYFVHFREGDYFPWEMRQAAAYLREHTGPDERVQMYGMDAYVLFLAERSSATPYIYLFELNADAAVAGARHLGADGRVPGILAMRDAHEADFLARLEREPPGAMVFIDKASHITNDDAVADFADHCPKANAWVRERYAEAASFGEYHVWLPLRRGR